MKAIDFKKHCRNLYFYVAELARVEEEIKLNDIYMSKPRSPRLEVIGAPAHNNESHIVDYIQRKMDLEKERQHYLDLIELVESIRTLPAPWNDILWETLVLGRPVRTSCKEHDISKDMYYRKLAAFTRLLIDRKRGTKDEKLSNTNIKLESIERC